jgi:hypothetical protein
MEITESFIEISLPYLVYIIKITNVISPINKKIQAKIHRLKEGTSKSVNCINVNNMRLFTFF